MSTKIQAAIDLLEKMIADEIQYLCDDEGYVDDINDELDEQDDNGVSGADTIVFLNKLMDDIRSGSWVPADWEDCESKAMEYYEATGNGMYGDSDMTDALQQGLMQAFELECDEEIA